MKIKTSNSSWFLLLSLIALIALIVVFGPLAVIWSLNTLFPILAIPFGFYQWAAVVFLNGIVFGKAFFTKKG